MSESTGRSRDVTCVWRGMRLAWFLLAACAHAPDPHPRTCDPTGIFVTGDLETVFGRLRKTVSRAHPTAIVDPLTRTISTDWYAVPLVSHEKARCDIPDTVTTFENRLTITLEGQYPFRIRIASQARGREVVAATGELRSEFPTTLTQFEAPLAARIREDFADFAVRCDNTSINTRCDPHPRGSPANLVAPPLPDGVTLAAPQLCEDGAAYLRVERTTGKRRLGVARTHGNDGGLADGCLVLPRDGSSCESINVMTVLHEAARRLRLEGILVNGTGMGPCGKTYGTYDVLNLSVKVNDWKDAGPAAAILGDVLADYDLRGYTGVGVTGSSCGVAY